MYVLQGGRGELAQPLTRLAPPSPPFGGGGGRTPRRVRGNRL